MSNVADLTDQMVPDGGMTTAVSQRIVLRDHIFFAKIGVTEEERSRLQRLCLNLTLELTPDPPREDDIAEVVNYGRVVREIRAVYDKTDYKLLESLVEAIAIKCFEHKRILSTKIRIEKLDRYADIAAIGVEIEHRRAQT